MKRILLLLIATVLITGTAWAETSQQKVKLRYDYTLGKLKLSKEKKAEFAPVLLNFIKELQAAKDIYDNVKDKYKSAIKSKKLTQAQTQQLLNAHWQSDAQEAAVKKKYTPQFVRILGAKAFYAFDYAGDSMKKIKE